MPWGVAWYVENMTTWGQLSVNLFHPLRRSAGHSMIVRLTFAKGAGPASWEPARRGQPRPFFTAVMSSPLVVSPLSSHRNAPPRPWFFE